MEQLTQLPRFYLVRYVKDQNGTLGRFFDTNGYPICCSLERPETYNGVKNLRDDKSTTTINESCCIPDGDYLVEWTYSNSFKQFTFEIKNVDGRDGIRIHSANIIDQLLGCVAPCTHFVKNQKFKWKGVEKVYPYFGVSSTTALAAFKKILPKTGFVLCISSRDGGFAKLTEPMKFIA